MRARRAHSRDRHVVVSDTCTVDVVEVTHEFPRRRGMAVRALDNVSLTIGAGELVAFASFVSVNAGLSSTSALHRDLFRVALPTSVPRLAIAV
jgi:hypothetical protein